MGPQPVGRGEKRPSVTGSQVEGWSFNGATASRPWRALTGVFFSHIVITASMGPQPVGRGEWGSELVNVLLRWMASMGPQPVGRGERKANRTFAEVF